MQAGAKRVPLIGEAIGLPPEKMKFPKDFLERSDP
jgi:hypothetical protein